MQIPPPNSRRKKRESKAFTLIELLTVMTIIGILAGLVLGTYKFVQDKGARSRAEAEIKAFEAALESYKADNGAYPRGPNSDLLNSVTNGAPTTYVNAGKELYIALSGDSDGNFTNGISSSTGAKQYFEFKPNQLSAGTSSYPLDPYGNAYGFSTIAQANAERTTPANPAPGYNPTFDLWSTCGTSLNDQARWVKNW